jgi:xylan 1,4-beta-xylosidase
MNETFAIPSVRSGEIITTAPGAGATSEVTLVPHWQAESQPFRHTWSPVANIDQFRWLSRKDVLDQLLMARDELGVRHVRAAAMYSPEMRVWDYDIADWRLPEAQRPRRANWQLVDLAIEGLLNYGLKPVYTTCFMPKDFTDDKTACWPDQNHTGMPRDLNQWTGFVASGVRHHLKRFGRSELRSWYFECWNEPNLQGCFFGGTKEDFFRLWSATWRAVKSIDPELKFGGPSTARGEWIPEFLDWTAKDGTPPDYLITHVYNNDSEGAPLSPFDGPASHKVKDSPHFATGVIRGLKREIQQRGWDGEIHWNEWGRSWFIQDDLKESALEAAFIAKTMCEVSQDADIFAFWCLSDIYNQAGFQSSEFQGHYGMLSLHGLRKPSWQAHMLLNRLGHNRLPVTGGSNLLNAVATRDNQKASVLVYAYPEIIDRTVKRQKARVELPGAVSQCQLFRISSWENNILPKWRDMGSPAYPSREQMSRLRFINNLTATANAVTVSKSADKHFAEFEIECPGVALLEFDL